MTESAPQGRAIVYPTAVTTVLWNGGKVRLRPDQQWPVDDPFVRARPEFFSNKPQVLARSESEPVIERATAAPGERRARRGRGVAGGGS